MSDDSHDKPPALRSQDDPDEPPVFQYHCISATAVDAILVATPADFPPGTDKMWHGQSLLTNSSPGTEGQWQPAPPSHCRVVL